jgi:anti-sigma B factor antagonist
VKSFPTGNEVSRTCPALKEQLLGLVRRRATVVVIDLTRVSFIDSTGLSALLLAEKEARRLGVQLRLAVGEPAVINFLRLTGLDEIFPLFASLDEALPTAVISPV